MARALISDYLQVYPFWLMDVAPIEGASLPIFNPLVGFSTITAPGMALETFDITEGNSLYRKKVIKKADIDPMTLTRGVTFFDSDFYKWTLAGLSGDPSRFQGSAANTFNNYLSLSIGGVTPRRNLMLIHFFGRYPGAVPAAAVTAANGASVALAGGIPSLGNPGALSAAAGAAASLALGNIGYGPMEFTPRIPAKAWMLYDCIPTRFKSGSDFDAKSGEISIAELEIQPEKIDEISLSS